MGDDEKDDGGALLPLAHEETPTLADGGIFHLDKKAFQATEPNPVPIDDPVLLCLHAFVLRLSGLLHQCAPSDILGDYDGIRCSEQSFERTVLQHMGRGRFLVSAALFELQNGMCLNRLRLWHIVQSESWTAHFLELCRLLANPRTPVSEAVALRAWFDAQVDFGAPPVVAPTSYVPVETRPATLNDSIREAMGGRPTEGAVALSKTLALALVESDERTLTAKEHARTQLATLAACVYKRHLTPAGKERVIAWLKAFAKQGCACAF